VKGRKGVGLEGEVEAWVDRIEDAEMVVVDGVEGGGGGARSTSHWRDAIGMLKGLGCHWQNMP